MQRHKKNSVDIAKNKTKRNNTNKLTDFFLYRPYNSPFKNIEPL